MTKSANLLNCFAHRNIFILTSLAVVSCTTAKKVKITSLACVAWGGFYRAIEAGMLDGAVLVIVILSVCLSVSLSIICVLCDKMKERTAGILTPHERVMTLFF